MLLAALVIAGLAWIYYGTRLAVWAGGLALGAFVLAGMLPRFTTPIYVLVGVGIVATVFFGRRRADPTRAVKLARGVRRVWSAVKARLDRK
jgi:hypothetical protein